MEQPQLAKPGAGLPFFEALLVRWYVGPFQSRKADKEKNLRLFSMIGSRLLKEAGSVAEGKRDERVLVPRMKGIEDSSRFWSVNETLEHVMITGEGMRGIIALLAAGKTSDAVVSIASFKPKGKYQGGDARPDFKKFLEETADLLAPLKIEDAGPTHPHPWLGPFNALQWTWLLAGHGGLHLAQLQAIKKGL
jgi:hypothetical protein